MQTTSGVAVKGQQAHLQKHWLRAADQALSAQNLEGASTNH